jgi:ZIP family zinc transporter
MRALAAAGWGAVAASSLVVGCGLTLWLRPSERVIGLTMGFGAGALISATSYELVLEAIVSRGPVVAGMAAGAIAFFAAGYRERSLWMLWSWVVAAGAAWAGIGYLVVSNVPGADGAFAQAFGAGAVLTMLADSLMPEALEHGGRGVGLVTVVGFIVATAFARLE